VPKVGVMGTFVSVEGTAGTVPQAESKNETMSRTENARDGIIRILIKTGEMFTTDQRSRPGVVQQFWGL
jgi:hypothetical protein